ncbi:MAG TPA: M56 family metallopeptidase [Vicinamibacterales bacterium]|nr:M56 family metallopeptidase [Vicinamibacterales bacterium]
MGTSLAEAAVALGGFAELAILIKATLALLGALVGVQFARHARASVRHLLVAMSFVVLLLLPAAAVVLTPIDITISSVAKISSVAPAAAEPRPVAQADALGTASSLVAPAIEVAAPTRRSTGALFSLAQWLRVAWAFGMLAFLVPMAGALWRVRRVRRNAVRWSDGEALARQLGADAGLSRQVVVLRHEDVDAPMTCGIVRPAIVLPWDVEAWSATDVRHALIHELEHVRRGDWPVHIMARVVCAAYWFHPLAWVAWRRLHLEAERACDDAVVRQSDGRAYAAQLVQLAEQLSANHVRPLLPMAGRGHLCSRVSAVLDERVPRDRVRAAWVVGAISIAIVSAGLIAPVRVVAAQSEAAAFAPPSTPEAVDQSNDEKPAPSSRVVQLRTVVTMFAGSRPVTSTGSQGAAPAEPAPASEKPAPAQSPDLNKLFETYRRLQLRGLLPTVPPQPTPAGGWTFEAASIRLNTDPNVILHMQQVRALGQRVVAPSTTVRELIRYAYDYQFRPVSHVVGGPEWLDTERYEVNAQAPSWFSPAPGRGMLPREASAMLRAMLAERMKLKVHVETRVRLIHALVLDRADGQLGPKLTPAKGECQPSMATPDPKIPLPPCPFLLQPIGTGSLYEMKGITMAELASTFGNFPDIDELVIDQTGLTGRYDMSVRSGGAMILSPFAPPVPRSVEDIVASEFPPIRQAIREQLGLRLERTRAPVEVIVIEHVERPSEN